MFAFIDWYIKLLTAILGWGSFLFVGLTGVALLIEQKQKLLGWCCAGYAVAFLIIRFFFRKFTFDGYRELRSSWQSSAQYGLVTRIV